jgi:hypothetical protein
MLNRQGSFAERGYAHAGKRIDKMNGRYGRWP